MRRKGFRGSGGRPADTPKLRNTKAFLQFLISNTVKCKRLTVSKEGF